MLSQGLLTQMVQEGGHAKLQIVQRVTTVRTKQQGRVGLLSALFDYQCNLEISKHSGAVIARVL